MSQGALVQGFIAKDNIELVHDYLKSLGRDVVIERDGTVVATKINATSVTETGHVKWLCVDGPSGPISLEIEPYNTEIAQAMATDHASFQMAQLVTYRFLPGVYIQFDIVTYDRRHRRYVIRTRNSPRGVG